MLKKYTELHLDFENELYNSAMMLFPINGQLSIQE